MDFLHDALRRVQREHPALDVVGLGLDFSSALALPDELTDRRTVFFYPGSSIGNFTPDEALAFLQRVRARASGGGLLIGVDLVKPAPFSKRPTTTRSASPRRSTSTSCASSIA